MNAPIITEGIRYVSAFAAGLSPVRLIDPDKTDSSLSWRLNQAHEELTAAEGDAACAVRKEEEVAERLEALTNEQRAVSEKGEQLPVLIARGEATVDDLVASEQRGEAVAKVLPTMREARREASHNCRDAHAKVRAKKENVAEIEAQLALRKVQKVIDTAAPALLHYFEVSGDEALLLRRGRVASPDSAGAEATSEDGMAD